jgi:hypothetical protein
MKAKLILLSVITLFLFSGCSEKVKYIYIKTPCPQLQTYEVNVTKDKHFSIHYNIKETNETKNR